METKEAPPALREVVAVVVRNGDDICLVRRSRAVSSDAGLWHCVTGYLEPGCVPLHQGLAELAEEIGIDATAVTHLSGCLLILDGWTVHVFEVEIGHRTIALNWENDDYCWTTPERATERSIVSWLPDVLATLPRRISAR